jgi:hypothetical protein
MPVYVYLKEIFLSLHIAHAKTSSTFKSDAYKRKNEEKKL